MLTTEYFLEIIFKIQRGPGEFDHEKMSKNLVYEYLCKTKNQIKYENVIR